MAESKVLFNLKNCYYAKKTVTVSQGVETISWSTPVHIPGAVSIAIAPDGEETTFYADGIKYYVARGQAGYSGNITFAKIPDQMLTDIWGMTEDTAHVLFEKTTDTVANFALLFQIDGDADSELYVLYDCNASRPNINAETNTEQKTPQTQQLDLTAVALPDGRIKARTTDETTASVRSGWFSAVYQTT